MKLSFSWLKEFLDLNLEAEELAQVLTLAGLEAEGIEEVEGDFVFEIGLTPNLGHCMSVWGIAREVAALLKLPLKQKVIEFSESTEKTRGAVSIAIEDDRCHRYGCRVVKNVKVGPSPTWLKKKLNKAGVRSINNVVDVGNLVMIQTGQPIHMFDYDQIQGKKIVVRSSKGDEMMKTLDEMERKIPDGVLLICDQKRPIAFAGVMGEASSAVSDETVNILIEAAYFTPEAVRYTSKQLNLRTDSSLRFERGTDPLAVDGALDLAASLMGGEVLSDAEMVIEREFKPRLLELNPERANRLLGTELSLSEMEGFLKRLGIQTIKEGEEWIRVEVPSFRHDLKGEIDLIEEVGRMFGLNNIPRPVARHASSMITHAPLFLFEEESRKKLIGLGLQEFLTCDLISPKLSELTLEKALKKGKIEVLHPASIDQSILRTTLLPGLLQVVKFNLDRGNKEIAGFEVGHIHFKEKENYLSQPLVGILLSGIEHPYYYADKPNETDFFVLKGQIENFLSSLGIHEVRVEVSHLDNFHPNRQARIYVGEVNIGAFGEVHPRHLKELDIDQRVYYGELNLLDLLPLKRSHFTVSKFSLFPGSERDWTITLDEKTPIASVIDGAKGCSSPLLENIFLLDLYKSEKIGKDKKNVTFRFQYRDPNKTIEYQEIETEHKKITQTIAKKLAIV